MWTRRLRIHLISGNGDSVFLLYLSMVFAHAGTSFRFFATIISLLFPQSGWRKGGDTRRVLRYALISNGRAVDIWKQFVTA